MTDMLKLVGVTLRPHWVGWLGPWPPPDTMIIAIGKQSGDLVVFEDESDKITSALTVAEVYRLKLVSASEVADSAPPDAHWFRGAEYELSDVLH